MRTTTGTRNNEIQAVESSNLRNEIVKIIELFDFYAVEILFRTKKCCFEPKNINQVVN